jgi:alpha-glucosidase
VRLRYKLLPYLYNLFVDHEETGEAILRPLFHDFEDTRKLPLSHVNDQFLVGPAIMQAPFTVEDQGEREIVLPEARWWRADAPGWIEGPARLKARKRVSSTPLFLREGSLIPLQRGIPKDNRKNLQAVELLVVLSGESRGKHAARYVCDDGETFAYRDGKFSAYAIEAEVHRGRLTLRIAPESEAFGPVAFTPVTLERFDTVAVESPAGTRQLKPRAQSTDLWGAEYAFQVWS